METVYVLQIVTILVSVINIIFTLLVSIYTNRAQNVANIVAKQRLVFLQQYREKSSLLLTLCTPDVLARSSDTHFEKELLQISFELKSLFKQCYDEENLILLEIDKVVSTALEFKENTGNLSNRENLNRSIQHLFLLINTYDLAYWRFIIDQASGRRYKVDDFDKYYADAEKRFKNHIL